MSKSYKFDLTKYYSDEEINNAAPIMENYFNIFGNDGVAELMLKDDVKLVIKAGEGAIIHMVIMSDDRCAKLPKTLERPRDFLAKFFQAFAKKIDEYMVEQKRIADEAKPENDLLDYISDDEEELIPDNGDEPTTDGQPDAGADDFTKRLMDNIKIITDSLKIDALNFNSEAAERAKKFAETMTLVNKDGKIVVTFDFDKN